MPDEADRAVAAVVEQVRAMHAGDFSDEEVDRARRYLAGSWVYDYQTVEQRADRLLELERWQLCPRRALALARADRAGHPPPGPPRRPRRTSTPPP